MNMRPDPASVEAVKRAAQALLDAGNDDENYTREPWHRDMLERLARDGHLGEVSV